MLLDTNLFYFSLSPTRPGTPLETNLKNNVRPVNPLDAAARIHDIAYSSTNNLNQRHEADKVLQTKAFRRILAKDASINERSAALVTTGAMFLKRKLGMGTTTTTTTTKRSGGGGGGRTKTISFQQAVNKARKALRKHPGSDLRKAVQQSLLAIKRHKINTKKIPRIISLPATTRGMGITSFINKIVPIFTVIKKVRGIASGVGDIVGGIKRIKNEITSPSKGNGVAHFSVGAGISVGHNPKSKRRLAIFVD